MNDVRARSTSQRRGLGRLVPMLLLLPALAVLGAQAGAPASAAEVCAGQHLSPPDSTTKSFTYTAPAGYLVSGWCVKAGPTPDYHDAADGHGHVLPAASVTIEHSTGKDVSHYSVVLVAVKEKPLSASVTADGTLARDHLWSIEKVADATTRTVDASGTATFTYTVTARAGAKSESGWVTAGDVTVTNPNSGGDVTADVTVTSDVGGGSSCTVTGGRAVVVPSADDVTLPYTCSHTSAPAGTGTVTATVVWDPAGAATSASTTASAPVSFVVASDTNKTVQVVDDRTVAGQRVVLDPALTWSAGLVRTYTYSLAVAGGAAGACASHTNTATIDQPVGTDPTATATVTACTPTVPPVVPPVTVPPVTTPPVQVPPAEVLPTQAFGKAGGSVRASCQGTVRSRLDNRSGVDVTYTLRVGRKVHRIVVGSLSEKRFTTTGRARAMVVLKVTGRTLDRVRIPNLCAAPEVLPDTGLRAAEARLGSITRRWRT